MNAIVLVRLSARTSRADFEAYLRGRTDVVDAWWVAAADVDAVLRLSCPTLAALDTLLTDLRRTGAAERTETHLVLSPIDLTARSWREPAGSDPVPARVVAAAAGRRAVAGHDPTRRRGRDQRRRRGPR